MYSAINLHCKTLASELDDRLFSWKTTNRSETLPMKMNLSELWKSGYADLTSASDNTSSAVLCQTATKHDLNTTNIASQVIVASCTGLFYLVILTLGVLGVWIRRFANLCSSRGTFFVFLLGALLASVNVFTNADNFEVKLYFRSSTVIVIGIAFTLFGAVLFFALPPREDANQPAILGRQQPSMGGVVGGITYFLFAIEVYLLVLSCRKFAKFSWKTSTTWVLVIIDKAAFLVQKPVQVIIYLYLRSTITREEYRKNGQFYFRILSFFNLIEWIDAQVNLDSDIQLSGPITPNGWFNVLTVLYKALIIDYRLLCCLLFLEHSMEIDGAQDREGDDGHYIYNMRPRDQLKRNCGFVLGFTCLTAPVLCVLYYFHNLTIEASVQIFAIVVNSVILISGTCFLCKNNLDQGVIREPIRVKIMVSSNNNNLKPTWSCQTLSCTDAWSLWLSSKRLESLQIFVVRVRVNQ